MERWLICYDVDDDRRRRKIAEILDGVGDRVQESVFEAVLGHALLDMVKTQTVALLDPTTDRIAFYRICAACEELAERHGNTAFEVPRRLGAIVV